jgi:hypothetical protein
MTMNIRIYIYVFLLDANTERGIYMPVLVFSSGPSDSMLRYSGNQDCLRHTHMDHGGFVGHPSRDVQSERPAAGVDDTRCSQNASSLLLSRYTHTYHHESPCRSGPAIPYARSSSDGRRGSRSSPPPTPDKPRTTTTTTTTRRTTTYE